MLDILKYHQRRNRLPQLTVIGNAVSDADDGQSEFYLLNGGLSFRNSPTIGPPGLPFLANIEKTAVEVRIVTLDNFYRAENLSPRRKTSPR